MGAISPPSKVFFTDINTLPSPGNSLITFVLLNASGQTTGQEFIWSDTANDYVPVGDTAYNVIGTWNASTNTPDYTTTLTTNGDALSVVTAGTTAVNNFNKWNVGDLLVRENNVFFRVPNQPDIISSLTNNSVPIFVNNEFVDSSISENTNTTMVGKELQPIPGSVILGGFELQERGGFAEDNSNISGRDFVIVDYEIQDSGTSDPVYYPRSAREGQTGNGVKPRADFPDPTDSIPKNNLTDLSIDLQTNSDIYAIYLNFRTDVDNFRFSITSPHSPRPIKYFPSQDDFLNGVGSNFTAGIHRLEFETPIGTVAGVTLTVNLEADNSINLLGNMSFPFINVDRQLYTESNIVHNDNVASIIGPKLVAGTNVTIDVDTNNNDITINSSGGGGSFIPGDHSVTEFNDVTDSGSGQIITDTERNKLNGIAEGAEVNVKSDWGETNASSDAFIQNKPTIPTIRTDEDIRDVVVSALRAGNGISITEDDTNDTITISATGTTFDAPRITNFRIDIDSRVDLNTNLNVQHTINYDVMHFGSIQSINLDVQVGTNQVLTIPSSDNSQSQIVTLSGIDNSSEGSVVFKITGVDTQGNNFESNAQTVQIRTLQDHEYLYYGLSSSDNPNTIDISTLTREEVTSSQRSYTVIAGPTTAGQYFILLTQDSEEVQSITDDVFNQDVTNIFTKTEDVRQINSNNYDSYVLGPLNAGATESFVVLFQ